MEWQLAQEVFRRFSGEDVLRIEELRGGNVNHTCRVETPAQTYICQRLNRTVLSGAADAIGRNYLRYCAACDASRDALGDWEAPRWLRTEEGKLFFTDPSGDCWRVYPMIRGRTYDAGALPSDGTIREFARGLAALHYALDRFEGCPGTVIAGFHDLDRYFGAYRSVRGSARAIPAVNERIEREMERLSRAEPIRARAVIHADTKLANAVFNADGRVIAFIDTDTISTGSRLVDLADSIRSVACKRGTADADYRDAQFRRDVYEAFASAYLASPLCGLSDAEAACIPQYLLRVTLELGIRYYSDYLRGNPYFHVSRPEETLRRALGQLALAEEIRRAFRDI